MFRLFANACGRIDIHTIDERELRDKVHWGVAALFSRIRPQSSRSFGGSPKTPCIARFPARILSRNSAGAGFRYAMCATPSMLSPLYKRRQIASWTSHGGSLILRKLVSKATAETLLSRLDRTPSDSVVTGRAGSGKTACIVEILDRLRERGLPALAFRSTASLFTRYRPQRTWGANSVSKNLRPSCSRPQRRPPDVQAF